MKRRFASNPDIISILSSIFVFGFSVALMLIWIFRPDWKEFSANTMKFNTCVAFALSAVSLFFARSEVNRTSFTQAVALSTAVLVVAIGSLSLFQYVTDRSLGMDELFVGDFHNAESSLFPGRMSPIAAACFVMQGISLVTLHGVRKKILFHPAALVALPVQILSLLALVGYLYDVSSFYQVGDYIRISWQAALCFFIISTAISFARSKDSLNILSSGTLGGVTARRLMPFAILLPLLLNWLRLYGHHQELFDIELGSAIQTVMASIFFMLAIWVNVRLLDKVDSERNRILQRYEISDRAMREAVRARDEFMSIASHELKTPLTALRLQSQLFIKSLNRGDLSQITPSALKTMAETELRQIDRLGRLIEDMLDIARMSAGRLNLERGTVLLSELVKDVVDRFRPQLDQLGYKVELDLKPIDPGWWDSFRIEQVISNLLTNAMKYGAGKPIHIGVAQAGNRARLTVSDEGVGIHKDNHERIFERFERAGSTNGISGLGLGLYIVKQIVQLHEGSIGVDSDVGRGASFIVELPLKST